MPQPCECRVNEKGKEILLEALLGKIMEDGCKIKHNAVARGLVVATETSLRSTGLRL